MGTPEKTAIVLLPGMDGTGELLRTLADQLSMHRPVRLIGYPVDRPLNYDQLVCFVRERVPSDSWDNPISSVPLGVGFGSLLIGTGHRLAYPCPLHRTVTRHQRRIRMI